MSDLYFRKGAGGILTPADDETAEKLTKLKTGSLVRSDFTRVQEANYRFLKKMHALVTLAYGYFCEHNLSEVTYTGLKGPEQVVPNRERFRHDLTILAGHYTPVFRIDGEVRLEAKSWSFAKASDEDRERIFSDLINATLKAVYRYQMSEDQLRQAVDNIIQFDG